MDAKIKKIFTTSLLLAIIVFTASPIVLNARDNDREDRNVDLYDRNRLNLDFSPYDYPEDARSIQDPSNPDWVRSNDYMPNDNSQYQNYYYYPQ